MSAEVLYDQDVGRFLVIGSFDRFDYTLHYSLLSISRVAMYLSFGLGSLIVGC